MAKIAVVNLSSVINALIPYGDAWLKKEHPEYPKQGYTYTPFYSTPYTDYGTGVRDAHLNKKAFEIIKNVSSQEGVDLVLKDDTVLHITNDLVILTDECIAEAKKLA